jgi:hypothetical protein
MYSVAHISMHPNERSRSRTMDFQFSIFNYSTIFKNQNQSANFVFIFFAISDTSDVSDGEDTLLLHHIRGHPASHHNDGIIIIFLFCDDDVHLCVTAEPHTI